MASLLNLRQRAMRRPTGCGPGWSLILCCALLWIGFREAAAAEFSMFPSFPVRDASSADRSVPAKLAAHVMADASASGSKLDRYVSVELSDRDDLIRPELAWYEALPDVRPRWLKLNPSTDREEFTPKFQAISMSRSRPSSMCEVATSRCPACQRKLWRCQKCSTSERINSAQSSLAKSDFILASNQLPGPSETLEHIDAEPDDYLTRRLSFREDIGHAWYRLRDDVAGVAQPRNLAVLALAGAGAIAIHQELDGEVRDYTARHPNQWGDGDKFLGEMGEVYVQAPVLAGLYLWSLKSQDEDLHDLSTTMWSAFTINGVSTVLLKVIVNSDRPTNDVNNGHFGFPSYHASSSFAIASVLNEYYGWQVGVPAYVTAGMIGWSRIDARHHDLSDVVFGAALGYVIGTSVARHQLTGDSRVLLLPWTEPQNRAVGMQLEWHF